MSSPITASYVVATHHLSRSHRDTSQKTNFDGYHINYARKYMREYAPQITAELGLKTLKTEANRTCWRRALGASRSKQSRTECR